VAAEATTSRQQGTLEIKLSRFTSMTGVPRGVKSGTVFPTSSGHSRHGEKHNQVGPYGNWIADEFRSNAGWSIMELVLKPRWVVHPMATQPKVDDSIWRAEVRERLDSSAQAVIANLI
jgi:hypothetical protein